jgi:hypothetical protein
MATPVKKSSENIPSKDLFPTKSASSLMSVADTKQFITDVNRSVPSSLTPNTTKRISKVKQEAIESLKEKGYQGGKTRRRNKKQKKTKKRRHH